MDVPDVWLDRSVCVSLASIVRRRHLDGVLGNGVRHQLHHPPALCHPATLPPHAGVQLCRSQLYLALDHVEHVFHYLSHLQRCFDIREKLLPRGKYTNRRFNRFAVGCARGLRVFLPRAIHRRGKLRTQP